MSAAALEEQKKIIPIENETKFWKTQTQASPVFESNPKETNKTFLKTH